MSNPSHIFIATKLDTQRTQAPWAVHRYHRNFFVSTGDFPFWEKTHCALNASHRYAFIHKTRRSKRELHNYVDKHEVHNTVCTQSGLLNSDLSSYVGSENANFRLLKVLAIGKTSGSGGWVKKLALITMKGTGLLIDLGNPKKQWGNQLALAMRQIRIWVFAMASHSEERVLLSRRCVAHTDENFWSVLAS
jgi:hypothetical protein